MFASSTREPCRQYRHNNQPQLNQGDAPRASVCLTRLLRIMAIMWIAVTYSNTTSTADTVFRSRLFMAWADATKLRPIINTKKNDAFNTCLCRSVVESILLYGLECLPMTLTLQEKLAQHSGVLPAMPSAITSLTACQTQS